MQLYVNEKKIRRNRTLGRWMMFGGLGASLIAVAISFLAQVYIFYALILMLAAGLVSQIGTAIYNRFGHVMGLVSEALKAKEKRKRTSRKK